MAGPWIYAARLVRVVDGDTLDLRVTRDVDFGFRLEMRLGATIRFRVTRIDTPEVVGATRAMGLAASQFVESQLRAAAAIQVESLGEPDKYGGRWDAVVRLQFAEARPPLWVGLAPLLCDLGYALPYNGKGPRPVWDPAVPYPLPRELRVNL